MKEPIKIQIKPLSVNQAWQGKRFKTVAYKAYEKQLLLLLPNIEFPPPPYKVYYEWGFSNMASDYDNPTKLVQDIASKKYGFNDNAIREATIKKVKVPKGDEYIQFRFEHYGDKT